MTDRRELEALIAKAREAGAVVTVEYEPHKVGDRVTYSGFAGTIIRTNKSPDSEWMGDLVEVRLASGVTCVTGKDCEPVTSHPARISVDGLKGVGPLPMSPISFAERMREVLR